MRAEKPKTDKTENDPIADLRQAKILDEMTPTVKILVEVPKEVYDLFKGDSCRMDFDQEHFYESSVLSAARNWLDLHLDVCDPRRLEAMRAIERLMLRRSLEFCVKAFYDAQAVLNDAAMYPANRELVAWANARGIDRPTGENTGRDDTDG